MSENKIESEKLIMTEGLTVAELVSDRPSRARVFEWFGIDYCCHGGESFEDACRSAGVAPRDVISELVKSDRQYDHRSEKKWTDAPLPELIANIVNNHHGYLRSELPRLDVLIRKVVGAHGERHPELSKLRSVFSAFRKEIESHLLVEEEKLFPSIREQLGSNDKSEISALVSLIECLGEEHLQAANRLSELRRLTDDYQMPADGCETYRVMLHSLHELEMDTHLHVHKENNILFKRLIYI